MGAAINQPAYRASTLGTWLPSHIRRVSIARWPAEPLHPAPVRPILAEQRAEALQSAGSHMRSTARHLSPRRHLTALCALGLALAAAIVASTPAGAQSTGQQMGRECQSIRTCRFTAGGSYRGCISAYVCRTCRPVRARCAIGTQTGNCHRLVCTWGA